VQPDLTV
jgi:hypothetical protein